jgi:hypothetical protein
MKSLRVTSASVGKLARCTYLVKGATHGTTSSGWNPSSTGR